MINPTNTNSAPALSPSSVIQSSGALRIPLTELIDLANENVGGKVLFSTDDFFAEKENLVKASTPIFIADKYTEDGKWMDGWESRRKRNLTPTHNHDYCIIKLGIPGTIDGFNIDTSFFTGNFPEYASIEACEFHNQSDDESGHESGLVFDAKSGDKIHAAMKDANWKVLLPKSRLQGGIGNVFSTHSELGKNRYTHLRLRIFPDGGVARLRVYGRPSLSDDILNSKTIWDLASAANGGTVIAASDQYFGNKEQMIYPGRAKTMGEGWETKRRRGTGEDWIIVKLATTGVVSKLEVDTDHYKGNYPDQCFIDVLHYPNRDLLACDFRDRSDITWQTLLKPVKLKPNFSHVYENELLKDSIKTGIDYMRISIIPDGGISRLRVWGHRHGI